MRRPKDLTAPSVTDPQLHAVVGEQAVRAEKAYDRRRCRAECRARSVQPCIARRGVDTSEKLGRHRWVVERTLAWLAHFRRLAIRYERRADIRRAFVTLGRALTCLNQIRRFS